MRLFLGVLLLMWAGVAVHVFGSGFRDWNRFRTLNLLSRISGKSAENSDTLHHVHAEPHSEIRTRSHEVLAPAPSVRMTRIDERAASTGTFVDPWTNEQIDYNGDVVTQSAPVRTATLNPRAEAYRGIRPEALETQRRPLAPSPDRPMSATRKAALRRRMILKYLAISISVTTVPAVLTSWTLFVASASIVWLAAIAWISLSIRQFVVTVLRPSSAGLLEVGESAIPDNVISIRRAVLEEEEFAPTAVVDEFYDPQTTGGFRRAQFAVGE